MIAKLICTPEASTRLCQIAGISGAPETVTAEIEFRELPYFLVSRSRETWTEGRGDINAVRVLSVNDLGIVVDPNSEAGAQSQATRHTIIPWTNIISLAVERSTKS